ncbi:MAG TPA: pitrilysin family protein [Actinocrinis sp.]|nr:pitrilysin family protein [Actinocrinis sp.]
MSTQSAQLAPRPAVAAPRPYVFPAVRRSRVGAGHILAAHLPGQPIIWLSLLLGGGALREPAGLDGLARATAGLLDEGTLDRSADEFGTAVESLGGQWSVDTSWETARLSIDLPVGEAEGGARMLAEAARRPAFTDHDVARYLADLVAGKRESFARPGPRAQAAFRGALFGAETRFGRLAGGDPDTAAALTAGAVRAFHAEWMREAGTLLVVGDLDQVDLDALGRAVFAGAVGPAHRPDARPGWLALPKPALAADPARLVVVDRPGAVQSTLRIGHTAPTMAEADAAGLDRVALRMASSILGGSFTSRLNHELREVKGVTYGARGTFDLGRPVGTYQFSAEVRTDATGESIKDTLRVIDEFLDGGATREELEKTRSHLAGAIPIELQTVGSVGHYLVDIVRQGLADDFVTTDHAHLLEVSLDEVNAAIRTSLRPSELVIAVEGDESVIGLDPADFPR